MRRLFSSADVNVAGALATYKGVVKSAFQKGWHFYLSAPTVWVGAGNLRSRLGRYGPEQCRERSLIIYRDYLSFRGLCNLLRVQAKS